MSLIDTAMSFIDGITSVIDVAGAIRGNVSEAISDGIENAFKRIRKPLELTLMRISFMFVSVFFMIWGLALFIDNFVPYNGLGFVIVGGLFGIVVFFFLKEKEE